MHRQCIIGDSKEKEQKRAGNRCGWTKFFYFFAGIAPGAFGLAASSIYIRLIKKR